MKFLNIKTRNVMRSEGIRPNQPNAYARLKAATQSYLEKWIAEAIFLNLKKTQFITETGFDLNQDNAQAKLAELIAPEYEQWMKEAEAMHNY